MVIVKRNKQTIRNEQKIWQLETSDVLLEKIYRPIMMMTQVKNKDQNNRNNKNHGHKKNNKKDIPSLEAKTLMVLSILTSAWTLLVTFC